MEATPLASSRNGVGPHRSPLKRRGHRFRGPTWESNCDRSQSDARLL